MSDKVTSSKRDGETNEEASTGVPRLGIERALKEQFRQEALPIIAKLHPASSVQWR
jgi:hypothetical protein